MRRSKRRPRTVRCRQCKSQNQSQPKGWVPIFCGRNCRQRADEHNLALRPTLTPDKHARARPRHGPGPQRHPSRHSGDPARHGLNPPPTPPHKLKRPHLRVGITGRGPVPNAGAGHGGSVSHLPASAACRHRPVVGGDRLRSQMRGAARSSRCAYGAMHRCALANLGRKGTGTQDNIIFLRESAPPPFFIRPTTSDIIR